MSTATLTSLHDAAQAVRQMIARKVVGQHEVIDQLLVAILAGQHCLLESAPGSARNTLAASLAQALGFRFHRVHCTTDLQPHELIEAALWSADHSTRAANGRATTAESCQAEPTDRLTLPNMLLVDDVSRLMPSARVVLDQAMTDGKALHKDRQVRVPQPFIVLATKYRQEDEPADVVDEPRDDRYMLKIAVRFPDYHEEFQVTDASLMTANSELEIEPVVDAWQVVQFQEVAKAVVAPAHVIHYALRLVRSTRVIESQPPDFAYEWIGIGAGPRASHHLLIAAKMRAAWAGREFAAIEDVQAMAHSVLRHRLVANQNARSNGITPDRIIDRLIYEIPIRIEGDDDPPAVGDTPKFDVTSDEQWIGE